MGGGNFIVHRFIDRNGSVEYHIDLKENVLEKQRNKLSEKYKISILHWSNSNV